MFTGTLIEDLIATVERAEANTQELTPIEIEPRFIEPCFIEPWIASAQENSDYDSKLRGVA
jgi:hypothetical protein